jgi:hypothetical protein
MLDTYVGRSEAEEEKYDYDVMSLSFLFLPCPSLINMQGHSLAEWLRIMQGF